MALTIGEANDIATVLHWLGYQSPYTTSQPAVTADQAADALVRLGARAGKALLLSYGETEIRRAVTAAADRLELDRLTAPESSHSWRDYTVHPTPNEINPDEVSVLCRSDADCEEHLPSPEGRYLTLGEAADWAIAHHASWFHTEPEAGHGE